jgi:hypothetical protein
MVDALTVIMVGYDWWQQRFDELGGVPAKGRSGEANIGRWSQARRWSGRRGGTQRSLD